MKKPDKACKLILLNDEIIRGRLVTLKPIASFLKSVKKEKGRSLGWEEDQVYVKCFLPMLCSHSIGLKKEKAVL